MTMDLIFPIFGIVLLLIGLGNELQWRRRSRHATLRIGRVIAIHDDGDGGYFPEIEYSFERKIHCFRSRYSVLPRRHPDDQVPVMVVREGGDAEHYTPTTRWSFTLVPIAGGLFFIACGIAF